ncbi:MAG: fatty acid--CoA ligase family protein [Planctomycetaceae bacterium]|nr:fatty acid--CoA ligase family protein [Planctomycetaceae bacterium]
MSLAARLSTHQSHQVLTDGRHTLTYAGLPQEFARLDQLWHEAHHAHSGGATILVGRNDLGSAVAGLYLLVKQRPCYFWRPTIEITGNTLPWTDLPEFCSTAVLSHEPAPDAGTSSSVHDYELALRPFSRQPANMVLQPYTYLGTSGTTARPKLAAYTPERMLGNAENCMRRFQLTVEDRVLLPLPIAHMYGLGAAFLPAVLAGASIYLLPQTNLLTYLQAERCFDPTVVFLTPALANQLIAVRKQKRPYRLSVMGADRMNPETFARYEDQHGCTVCVYGSTELGAVAASHPDDTYERRQHSSGRLMDQVRIVSVPRSTEPNDQATLAFDHPFAMAGYANAHGEPELPADVFRDGAYLTRDVGGLDELGDLRIYGRADDAVKRNGYLVAFSDVERALEQLPEIDRAVVISGEATSHGVGLVAFCVQNDATPIDETSIRKQLQTIIPSHAVPDRLVFLDQLPLTTTGKPDRQALRSLIGPA